MNAMQVKLSTQQNLYQGAHACEPGRAGDGRGGQAAARGGPGGSHRRAVQEQNAAGNARGDREVERGCQETAGVRDDEIRDADKGNLRERLPGGEGKATRGSRED